MKSKEVFLSQIKQGALNTWTKYQVLPSIVAAQGILESKWGCSELALEGNNLFGIKANSSWRGKTITLPTEEYKDGKQITVNAKFRKYDSWSDCIEDHGLFFVENSRYKKAIGETDYKKAITEIHKAGYATDPQYASKIVGVIESNKLYQLDDFVIKMERNGDTMNKFVVSSGHSLKVRGAASILDEVNEARKVISKVAIYLKQLECTVHEFHDNTSTTQTNNINTIVKYHNSKNREMDVSVHFNAASKTNEARGVEVLYYSDDMKALADKVSKSIADVSGLKNRGAKKRTNLGFLSGTDKPALLIEVCFVDSSIDAKLYNSNFDSICRAIATSLTNKSIEQSSSPKPVNKDTRKYRVSTGTFKDKKQQKEVADKVRKDTGWTIYEIESNGLRLQTGAFIGLESAEKAQSMFKEKYGYISYIKEV